MSCFCCPCRFESRKNPHFGVQEGAKYELYINIDGIFRVAHRFGFFVKMPAPGTFLCFASVIFPRRFVVMPCSPCLSTVIPASSVKCIAFSRLAPGSPHAVFLHASSFFAFSRLSAPPLGRSLSPTWASFVPAWAFFVPAWASFSPAWAFSAPCRGRIPIGKQALPRSAGKREVYRKRRKLTNELPPLLNGIFGHTLRFAPAALLPRNIRYGKTACRPTLPVSRG